MRNLILHQVRLLLVVGGLVSSAFGQAKEDSVSRFLSAYCVKCHGVAVQKGDRRFDALPRQISDDNQLVDTQDIVDLLNLGEMPPKEERQPTDAERRAVIRELDLRIQTWHRSRHQSPRETVLRRLNAREYRNTVRDLLKINTVMFDPTEGFPADQQSGHLDNVGETLVMSGHLLHQYLNAADRVVNKAISARVRPEVQTWKFSDNFQQQPEIDQVHRSFNNFEHITLYEVRGADKHEGAYAAIRDFVNGVPVDGFYEISFTADAMNRDHQYDDSFLGVDRTQPFRLGIVSGDVTVGDLHHTQPIEPILAEIPLKDGRHEYSLRVWLDQARTPRFTFENGSMDVRGLWSRVFRQYPKLLPKLSRGGIVEARKQAIAHGQFPQIRIDDITITGPHYEDWPTAAHRSMLGDDWERTVSGEVELEELKPYLTSFLSRAWRRNVEPTELERYWRIVQSRARGGRSLLDAYADGIRAILCSPGFLYLDEPADDDGRLAPAALASRLAYLLWSSMPDEELLSALEKKPDSDMLTDQTRRLLNDPRSAAFVSGFCDAWLTLDNLGATPPERSSFPEYYQYDLQTAMRTETETFFRDLIDRNGDIGLFLDADYTFVNRALARHYQLTLPRGDGFHRVKVNSDQRGGLLGHASVLTVTANGIDTSPVVRGVWVLENMFGTPPSPPPPDVEPLDPDVRGAKTIRDQLQKHRSVAACNDCHRRIDPPGFALENFDPVGGWRTKYGNRAKIDASGTLVNGDEFGGFREFRSLLMNRKPQFARALTTRLLEYGLGRRLQPADRPQVELILQKHRERGSGFRELIELVVQSDLFRGR